MIICLCRGLSESKLFELSKEANCSPSEAAKKCGAGRDCGACSASIRRICRMGEESVVRKKEVEKDTNEQSKKLAAHE